MMNACRNWSYGKQLQLIIMRWASVRVVVWLRSRRRRTGFGCKILLSRAIETHNQNGGQRLAMRWRATIAAYVSTSIGDCRNFTEQSASHSMILLKTRRYDGCVEANYIVIYIGTPYIPWHRRTDRPTLDDDGGQRRRPSSQWNFNCL